MQIKMPHMSVPEVSKQGPLTQLADIPTQAVVLNATGWHFHAISGSQGNWLEVPRKQWLSTQLAGIPNISMSALIGAAVAHL